MEIDRMRARFDCRRRLAMSPRLASRALLQLRRDYPESRRRWTLGAHGSFEMQASIVELAGRNLNGHGELHMSGRLWDPAGTTMTGVDLEVRPIDGTAVDVVLQPSQRLPEWFRDHDLEHWRELAHAALDELCEELLFYATRDADADDGSGVTGESATA